MSQLHGKQLSNTSTSLDKLSGTGIVAFNAATMSFGTASVLRRFAPTEWDGQDLVNKKYVDSVVQGLDIKESVRVKFNTNVTISGVPTTTQGVTFSADDRVLLTGQDTASENGIWLIKTGSWERPDDFKAGNDKNGNPIVSSGAFTFVEEGDFEGSGFVLTTDDPITVGSTELSWSQFSGAGQIDAGAGLEKDGNTLNIDLATNSGLNLTGDKLAVDGSIAGQGLTLSSGVLNVGVDTSGLSVDGTNVSLNTTITGSRTFSNGLTINQGADINSGATVSGAFLAEDGATIQNGATVSGGLISDTINVTTITGGTGSFTNLTVSEPPSTDFDAVNLAFQGASFSQLQLQISDITGGAITDVTAGAGLSGGGTQGQVTLDVNVDGDALEINANDEVSLKSTITGGRTFSNGLTINEGVDITGGATIFGEFLVQNGATIQNGAEVNGGLDVNGGATVSGSFLAEDGATIQNGAEVNGGLDVNGGATVSGSFLAEDGATIQNGANITGGATVSGAFLAQNDAEVSGNLLVSGNFTVSGTTTFVDTQELEVTDNIITLAKGNTTGSGVDAGIKVDRGTDPQARFIWNESKDLWTAGLTGSEEVILLHAGAGLTKNGATVSIDTAATAPDLAGNGLTANAGALDINVDISGLTISNDVVALQDTITGNRTFSDSVTIDKEATVRGLLLADDGVEVLGGLISDTIDVTTITGGTGSFTNLTVTTVAASDNDAVNFKFFTDNAIQEVTGGAGLSGAGTTGSVTLDVNTGLGLTISGDDVAMVWGGTQSGLTFSGNAVKANVDESTIIINSAGELEVVDIAGLKAEPVYERFTGVAAPASSGEEVATISDTPSEHSRIEVYVNGLKVVAQGDVGGLQDTIDDASVRILGKKVTWLNNDYSIEPSDVIEIVYEA